MSNKRPITNFKSGPYDCTFTPLGDEGRAMSNQALLVIRKEDDRPHIPTFSGQVPLEVAQWIEKLVKDNEELKDKQREMLQ